MKPQAFLITWAIAALLPALGALAQLPA